MLNFIINFTRVILFVIISVSSHVSIAMDGSDSETDSSLKRKRTFSSEEGKTDDSDFDTPLENKAKSLSDPRIQALLGRSDFTFTPAYKPIQKVSANPASKRTGKENIVNGSEGVLKGAWYRKPETGNWVLNLGSVKGYATIIPGSVVELLFGSAEHRETFTYPSVLIAQHEAEYMATKRGFLFERKKTYTKKAQLLKRR